MVANEGFAEISDMQTRPWSGCHVLIIESRFYHDISDALYEGAANELASQGVEHTRVSVPGALEIPQVLASSITAGLIPRHADHARYCGAVVLGCVIRGETSHYETVCDNANHWAMQLSIKHAVPLGNGILTVETREQALARAMGGSESKGAAAARACLRLIEIQREFQGQGA